MVNLLKEEYKKEFRNLKAQKSDFQNSYVGRKDKDSGSSKENPDDAQNKNPSAKLPSLSRYHDPEGLTVGKMEFGLWLLKQRPFFRRSFYFTLIVIGIATWGLFFYTFGHYIAIGMKQDKLLADDLVRTQPISHDLILAQMPKTISYGIPELFKNKDLNSQMLVEIENPNEKHWATINYSFRINGEEVVRSTDFILPKEKKFLIDTVDSKDINGSALDFVINSVSWQRHGIGDYEKYNDFWRKHIDFSIENLEFVPAPKSVLTEKVPLNQINFDVKNNSAYNYWRLPVNIILLDGEVIKGATEYSLEKCLSGSISHVNLSVSGIYDRVKQIKIIPNLNILQDDIYMEFN